MFAIRKTLITGVALLAVGVSGANAADLNGRGSLKDPPPAYVPSVATQPSWYARMDFAFATHDAPVMVENGTMDLTSERIDDTWSFGGGIGRRFTTNIRGDLTYERRFEADASGNLSVGTLPGTRSFGLSSDLFLANVYYDFNEGGRFVPYLGVGLGFVRHKASAGVVTPNTPCGCAGTIDEETKWSVAGAFMAGVSIALKQRSYDYGSFKHGGFSRFAGKALHLDLGYRFLYLGDATTGAVRQSGTSISQDPTVEDLHAHEFRVGLRYELN